MNWVNKGQSTEERRVKYAICRDAGLNRIQSVRLRDWTISHLLLYLNCNCSN
jgi:hypothetical protein